MKHLFRKRTLVYLILLAALGSLGVGAVTLLVVYRAQGNIVSNTSDLSPAQVAIVLGASVYESGRLSAILQDRVDTAIAIYREGLVRKILVSGDNSTLSYNEVVPVRAYLLEQGIPPEDVFLDYAGFDTYDSMYRARAVFAVESAIVVTQSFHLYRAVYIAQALGITVQGVSTVHDTARARNYLREVPANVKAVLNVVLRSKPTYLGEPIPITGDGRVTHIE